MSLDDATKLLWDILMMNALAGVYIANDIIHDYLDDVLQGNDDFDFVSDVKRELNEIFEMLKIKYVFDQNSEINKCEVDIGRSGNENDLVTFINNYMGSRCKFVSRESSSIHSKFIESIKLNFNQSILSKRYELNLIQGDRYELIKKESSTSTVKSPGYNDFISYLDTPFSTQDEQIMKARFLKNEAMGLKPSQNEKIVDIWSTRFPMWLYAIITHEKNRSSNTEERKYDDSVKWGVSFNFENLKKEWGYWDEHYTEIITNVTLPQALESELSYLKNRMIPNISDTLKELMDRSSVPSEGTWRRLINFIVAHLFPSLSKEINMKMVKSKSELENFYLLLLEAKKEVQDAEQNIDKSPCIYHLACQLLEDCIPAQYPFDPLDVLSPDRKVWLELQKEWLKPLESKFDEPKLSL